MTVDRLVLGECETHPTSDPHPQRYSCRGWERTALAVLSVREAVERAATRLPPAQGMYL